jgi:hypothetical protein
MMISSEPIGSTWGKGCRCFVKVRMRARIIFQPRATAHRSCQVMLCWPRKPTYV